MSVNPSTSPAPEHVPEPAHEDVPRLEYDETVPPRPEEEIADATRT